MKPFLILQFHLFFSFYLFSQTSWQLDSLESILPQLSNTKKVEILNQLAYGHRNNDKDWKKVDSLCKQSLELSRQINCAKGEADALLNLSFSVYNRDNDIKKSSEILFEAREIYTKLKDTLGLAWTNRQIGYNCFFQGQLKEMSAYYKTAYKYFYLAKNALALEMIFGSTYTYFAGYTKKSGNEQFYKEIISDFENTNNLNGIAFFYNELSNAYLNYRDYDSSALYIKKTINMLPLLTDYFAKGMILLSAGNYYFSKEKEDSANYYFEQAEKTAKISGNVYFAARAFYFRGNMCAKQKNMVQAEIFYTRSYNIANSFVDKELVLNILSDLGRYNYFLNNYGIALKYYYLMLKIVLDLNDKGSIASLYTQISDIYKVLKEYEKALEYAQLSLNVLPEENTNYNKGIVLYKIGILYYLKNDYPTAIDYLKRSEINLKTNNIQRALLTSCYYLGLCYLKTKDYPVALEYFNKTIELKKITGVKIKTQVISISVYGALARLYFEQKNLDKALSYGLMCLEEYKVDLTPEKNSLKDDYYTLYEIYKAKNNIQLTLEYHEKYTELNEQIASDENSRKITNLEIQAATEKQEKENELLKKDNLLKEKEAKQQAFTRNVLIAGFLLMFLLSVVVFRSYKQKKKANELLEKQQKEILLKNTELEQQKEEILAQAENLEQANIEITAQKDIIEISHKNITDSILYAKRIQTAVLPNNEIISMLLPSHFIFFKPCDIVSGDFYYLKQVRQFTLLCVADCTGHGVPGAFMSMLGIALLNEIVLNKEIYSADLALNELRRQIKNALQQTGQGGEQQDGMDIAFCAINLETMEMSFAGAHNPLWLFRNQNLTDFEITTDSKYDFIELPADRQPVGIYLKERPFTEQKIQLEAGDTFYIFSDGYHSQFGGKRNETLKVKRFKELLSEIHQLPISKQREILEQKFNEWKKGYHQTDDVLVLGVRI